MNNNEIDRIECAIRHIQTAVDVDPWAVEIAVDAMKKQISESVRKHCGRSLGNTLVCIDAHNVSAQDGRVLVPLLPHSIVPAAKGAAVHYVVVDKSECMENLQTGGGFKDVRAQFIGKYPVRGKAQTGPDALPANFNHIPQRVIQPRGLFLELDVAEKALQGLRDGAFRNHCAKFSVKIRNFWHYA